jgi:AcrR family transcriptional regulator
LFVEVMERVLRNHQAGIAEAVARGGDDLRAQLQGIADWLVSQPPMDLIRMVHVDLPAISASHAEYLEALAHEAMLEPLEEILAAAQARGQIAHPNLGHIAGGLFWAIEGLHSLPDEYLLQPRAMIASELIEVFLKGLSAPGVP